MLRLKNRSVAVSASALSLAIAGALLSASTALANDQANTPRQLQTHQSHYASEEIQVEVERDGLPADGQTPAKLHIRVLDASGQPLQGEVPLTVTASAGRLQIPGAATDEAGLGLRDLDLRSPGTQLIAKDGVAEIWLLAPVQPQTVDVQISTENSTVARGELTFVPELREMIAVGLVDGIINFDSSNPLSLSQARPDDGFEDQIRSWSRESGDGKRDTALRTAMFLKGKIKGDALLTFAYDSDKPGRDRLFRDLDPERWYPVYGDSSIVGFEARSNSRLYLRIDKDRNYVMYGDIATGAGFSERFGQGDVASTQVRDLGQYNRAMTGVRGHLENERGVLDVFAADDNLRQVVEEFPGRGLSGPYTVSNSSNAVLGTERVEIITRDRYAPSRIVETRQLSRFVDYTFEPFSGRILFTRAVPSVDESLNPVSVRISYEVDQGGENYWVYGVSGQFDVTGNFNIGGNYVKDENPLAPFELASANATVNLGKNTWLRGEYAHTNSAINAIGGNIYTITPNLTSGENVSGDAWRAEFGHNGARSKILAWYGESDAGFNNPSSSYLGGRRQAGFDSQLNLGAADQRVWELYAQGSWIDDQITGADRTQVQAGARVTPVESLTLEFGANYVSEHAGSALGNGLSVPGNLTAPYGVGVVSPGLGGGFAGGAANALNPGNGQTLYNTGAGWSGGYGSWVGNGLAGVAVEYTALRLGATWRPTDKFDVSAEVEQDINHSEHRRASLGAGVQVQDKTRLYGRYEWNTGLSTVATSNGVTDPVTGNRIPSPYETNALVLGVDTEYMEGGTLFNEYRMYDSFSARQAQWASGVRNLWHVSPELTLQTGFENLEVLDGSGQQSTAASVAAEWRPDELWLINGRLEWRRADSVRAESDAGLPVQSYLTEGYDTWLSTFTVARKVSRDWTVLARNYYLLNDYDSALQDSYEDRFQLGFAYRDTDTNRVNVLGKYEYWTRRDQALAGLLDDDDFFAGYKGYDKHVASVHADWHPNRVWWLTGRIAGKRQTDLFDAGNQRFTAYLVGGRVTYGLSERWDVSALAYQNWSPGGATQYALGAEVGYLVTSNLWLSAGYNARGFRDDDLTGSEYTNEGVYLRLRFKFDEDLFQGNNADVNRSLPR